jgi:hypothetical protein
LAAGAVLDPITTIKITNNQAPGSRTGPRSRSGSPANPSISTSDSRTLMTAAHLISIAQAFQ